MLKNYLLIAWRSLWRHPLQTSINVVGLAVGIACCLLIVQFVADELKYDRFHEKADAIYRVVNLRKAGDDVSHLALTPPAFAPTMKADFPEVLEAVRLFDGGRSLVEHGERRSYEPKVYYADSTFFDVFMLPLQVGDPRSALTAPYSIVVSRSIADKYFPGASPLGKTLRVEGLDMTVTGVAADPPRHSHVDLNVLISFSTLSTFDWAKERLSNFRWQQFFTYLLLPEGVDPGVLEAKFPAFVERHAQNEISSHGFTYTPYLQPLTDIHLKSSHLQFDWGERGDISYLYIFSGVALVILLIACFNFMNLSTAHATLRAKEVGLRKVVGARRSQLVRQFLSESVVVASVALVAGLLLAEAATPVFNAVTGKELDLQLGSGWTVIGLIGLCVLVGLAAGSYPALYLSAFRPIGVLRGGPSTDGGSGLSGVRRALVIGQFAISIALIIGTGVVHRQLDYIRTADLGFERDLIVKVPLRGDTADDVDAIKNELLGHSAVISATASHGTPGSFAAGDDIRVPGRDASWPTKMFTVDFDFLETYEMEIVAGRGFSRDRPADAEDAFLLNETAARALGWTGEEALGQPVEWDLWGADGVKEGTVIGVVRDFNYAALHEAVDPLVIHVYPSYSQLSVKIRPDRIEAALAMMEDVWNDRAPEWPFEFEFLDDELARQYLGEQKLATVVSAFTGLAILIACLGLFGLASFMVERRTKEIGIRKVLGASVRRLVVHLSKDFALLVGTAFVLAAPLAYVAAQRWLDNFAFRIPLGVELFVAAGLAALIIALLTVSTQTVRAALRDPVESLRAE